MIDSISLDEMQVRLMGRNLMAEICCLSCGLGTQWNASIGMGGDLRPEISERLRQALELFHASPLYICEDGGRPDPAICRFSIG